MPELAMTKEEYRRRTGLEPTGPVMPMPGQPTMPQGEPPLVQALSKVGGMLGQAANTQQQVPIEKVAPQIYPSGLMPEQVSALQNAQAGREQQAASINLTREEMAQKERGQERYLGAQQQQQERNIQADKEAAQVRRQQELQDQETQLKNEKRIMRLKSDLEAGEWKQITDPNGGLHMVKMNKDGTFNMTTVIQGSPAGEGDRIETEDGFFEKVKGQWVPIIAGGKPARSPRARTGGTGRGTQAERTQAELGMTTRQYTHYKQLMEEYGLPEPDAYAEAMGQGAGGGGTKEGRVAVFDAATNSIVYKTPEEISGKGGTPAIAPAAAKPTQAAPTESRPTAPGPMIKMRTVDGVVEVPAEEAARMQQTGQARPYERESLSVGGPERKPGFFKGLVTDVQDAVDAMSPGTFSIRYKTGPKKGQIEWVSSEQRRDMIRRGIAEDAR